MSAKTIAVSGIAAALAACSSLSPMNTGSTAYGNPSGPTGASAATAVIGALTITTIGSTVDRINGDQNPYGLAIAPASAGMLTAGDLVICNFNDSANVQGNGTTIEILHPVPGSMPTRLVQDKNLKGCAAVA